MDPEQKTVLAPTGGSGAYPSLEEIGPSLCTPDREKTCFGCCPPIRPAGYVHVDYRAAVSRMLRENTASFPTRGEGISPIRGYSCWALGYLDSGYRRIGCLLHPAQNLGMDLRHRVDFGDKCRRETCPEAKVFDSLTMDERRFWLCMAEGLDAFTYSSRKHNSLFHMMGWGEGVLGWVARNGKPFPQDAFFEMHPFFRTTLNPWGHAYLLSNILLTGQGVGLISLPRFRDCFEHFSRNLICLLKKIPVYSGKVFYTHLLSMDRSFLDFLRLSCGFKRLSFSVAARMKARVDRELENFKELLARRGMS